MGKPPTDLEKLLGEESKRSVDLRGMLYALRNRCWVVVAVLLVCATAAAVYLARAPKIYAATTVLLIEQQEAKVVKIDGVVQEDLRSQELVNTLLQSMRSRLVLQKVVDREKLHENQRFLLGTGSERVSLEAAVGILDRGLKIELRKGTRLVDVTIEHRIPEMARQLANSLVTEFLRYRFEQRATNTSTASTFLFDESSRLKEKLQGSEEALHRYMVENNAVSLQQNQDTVIAQLKSLSEKLSGARADRVRLEGDVARAKELAGKPEALILLASVATHPEVLTLRTSIADKEAQIVSLSQTYKPKHPKYAGALTQLANLKQQLDRVVVGAGDLVSASYRTAKETEAQFAQALQEQEKHALELNRASIQYNVLLRETESNRAMYESVLGRLKETDVTKELEHNLVQVLEPAAAYGPVRPDRMKVLSLGIAGGSILGVGLVIVLFLLDSSVKTVDEAEEVLGLPVLAAVPLQKQAKKGSHGYLPTIDEPEGMLAESFRTLRSSLLLLGRQESRRTFLFTSAVPSEGKSFTCGNYAIVSAKLGTSTLLIDADLRRPTICESFFVEDRRPGLSDFLVGQSTFERAVHVTDVENLSVMPAGTLAPNPSELLASGEFQKLIDLALAKYDRVVIDTAPVHAVSDTLIIARYVQTVCLVVAAGVTPRAVAQRAQKLLSDSGSKPAGIVLNRLPRPRGVGYYYYYNAGQYGREGVYGAKPA